MKKLLAMVMALALLLAMTAVPVAVAEGEELPFLEISWAGHADTVPPAEEGTDMQKYLEEKWNVKINLVMITHMEQDAWDLYFASGDTVDHISNPGARYNMLIDQALVRPVPYEWLEEYMPNWMAKTYEMVGSAELTRQMLTYTDGNTYAAPYIAYTAAFPACMYIRTDWLENVGLEVPTTLDEYHDVVAAFVNDDPDGNGQNDTLGISGANFNYHYIYGAYGVQQDTYNLQDDGTVTYSSVGEAYKEALRTLSAWYAEGLIDPESFTDDRAKLREKWSSGMIGIMGDNAWWGEESRGENSVFNMLYNRDENAEVTAFAAITGPDGLSGGAMGFPGITGQAAVLFGADASDEKVQRIMAIKESFTDIDEYVRGRYGIEGETYDIDENGVLVMRPEWNFELQRGMGIGQFYAVQPQSPDDAALILQPSDLVTNEIALSSNPVYSGIDFFAPVSNTARETYGGEVETIAKEYRANVIMGKTDLDATWDDYVAQMNAAGLTSILEEYENMLK